MNLRSILFSVGRNLKADADLGSLVWGTPMKFPDARAAYVLLAVGFSVIAVGFLWDYQVHAAQLGAGGHAGHEEPFVGPPAHDAVLAGAGLVGVGLAAVALRRISGVDLATRVGLAKYVALVLLLADGAIHLFAVNEHLSIVAFAAFFLAAGIGELALPVVGGRRDRFVAWAGIAASAALIALFVYSRIFPAPISGEVEEVDALGVLSKVIEAAAIALLAYVLLSHRASRTVARTAGA